MSIDYGTQNAMVFLLWGLKNNRYDCIKEYYYSGREKIIQKTDNEYYDDLVDFLGNIHPKVIIIDPSAASFIALIRKNNKYKVRKAKNDVIDGIRNVATALSYGIINFYKKCEYTLKEFSTYVWDEKAAQKSIEKPIKEFDHCMDALRYFVHTIIFGGKPAEYNNDVLETGYGVIKTSSPETEIEKLRKVYGSEGGVF